MRNFLGFVLLAGYALAAPNQVVIGDDAPGVPVVQADERVFHHDHHAIDTNLTIYDYLKAQEDFSKLVKLIDYDEAFVEILNATTNDVTFFAPDNKALTPKKGHHGKDKLSLANMYAEYERLYSSSDDDDDEEKKRRFKIILRKLLEYHTIPQGIPKPGLYVNSTYETALVAKEPGFGGQPRRILISGDLIGRLFVNYYVTIDWKSVNSTTGYLYTINHPIIPPPSILDELFLIDQFSTLTSALQKVGLDDELQWRWNHDDKKFEGDGPTVSLFAPNDWAFKRLPWRLRLYLFSPAGEKALKKLLSFHIVPNWILHSDFVYNGTAEDFELKRSIEETFDAEGDEECTVSMFHLSKRARKERKKIAHLLEEKILADRPHHNPPNVTVNITLSTLLDDHSLQFAVIKPNRTHHHFELFGDHGETQTFPPLFRSFVLVNHVPVGLEGVARNGAVYLLRRVLNPFKAPSEDISEDDLWSGWEDYLPAWGEQ